MEEKSTSLQIITMPSFESSKPAAHPWISLRTHLPWLRGDRVHALPNNMEPALRQFLEQQDFCILCIEGTQVRSDATFFEVVPKALVFPDYCGHNWNAIVDCLRDLDDGSSRRVAVLWTHAEVCVGTSLQTVLEATLCFERASIELAQAQPYTQLEFFLVGSTDSFSSSASG